MVEYSSLQSDKAIELTAGAKYGRALQLPERQRDRLDGRGADEPALQLPERQRDRVDSCGAK